MERCKMILRDNYVRLQAVAFLIILLLYLLINQLIVVRNADDYKRAMLAHDYEVAGYLLSSGIDKYQVAAAFTTDKSNENTKVGLSLLSSTGYSEETQNNFLPSVERFYYKYALIVLAATILFSLFIFFLMFLGELRRDKRLEKANIQLRSFMDGDTSIRLNNGEEGRLSSLFVSINAMATSLTAHAEKEKQNLEFLKNTISDISHQLKTPLAALLMYNEIIMDEINGSEVIESFTVKSRRELVRMENLIKNLLKLARLDVHAIELNKSVYNVKDFLENILSGFLTCSKHEGKSISIICNGSATLCFDQVWLGEAVTNIIKNAIDHTTTGDFIEISFSDAITAAEFIIKDSGNGIHPEDIHYIFKRFYRSRFSKNHEGIGIGLPISKAIVEKHGGTITVQNRPEGGAEFHIIFPKLTKL